MNEHAVVLAGDFRTMEYGVHTYAKLFENADVYISFWSTSQSVHKTNPKKPFDHGTMDYPKALSILWDLVETIEGVIEDYDPAKFQSLGYNTNYLHRQRAAVELIQQSGIQYKSVFFMRPDMFFGRNVEILTERVRSVSPGQFVTIYAMGDSIHKKKMLNDIMWGVAFEDLDRAVPTLDQFKPHRHRDWHTFYYDWILNHQQMKVINVPEVETVILRPPVVHGMTYQQAVANVQKWDDAYIIHAINKFGVREAIRQWDKRGVLRAISNLED